MLQSRIGTVQTAIVIRMIDTGYVLKIETDEVLMHHNESDKELNIGEEVNVFLYNDKNNQIVATMSTPTIQMDTYGWAEVVNVVPRLGVFVDIGITKEILVSNDDLPLYKDVWPKPNDKLFVTLGKDKKNRLLAIPASEDMVMFKRKLAFDVHLNDYISGHVYYTSKEGSAVFSEEGFRAFIHHTERDAEPRLGELVQGRVIDIKDDGTLNLSLLPFKEERIDSDAKVILHALNKNDGVIDFGDKSDAVQIRKTFHMSKSAFKRALGRLMKQRKIEQRNNKTYLLKR